MTDSYRVLIIEDDPDPTTYLRLALLRTQHGEHPVRCPASVRALLRGVTGGHRAGTDDSACDATMDPPRPITLILDENPACLEVLSAYFGDAGCAVIAVTDIEQALSMCSVVSPDLMVSAQARSGIDDAELDTFRSRHPNCRIVVTTVLDSGAALSRAPQDTESRSLAAAAK